MLSILELKIFTAAFPETGIADAITQPQRERPEPEAVPGFDGSRESPESARDTQDRDSRIAAG
jgi:hypothetical protein